MKYENNPRFKNKGFLLGLLMKDKTYHLILHTLGDRLVLLLHLSSFTLHPLIGQWSVEKTTDNGQLTTN
ncbi:MAG TPA: hypothetical protein V6D48_08325 [Oculatellaceae cyanobacterium]